MPKKPGQLARLLGKRIAELRTEKGLTQEGLAWAAEFGSKGYMSRIEGGERLPSLTVLERLAKELEVEVRDLFIFPERGEIDEAMERVRRHEADLAHGSPGSGRAKRAGRAASQGGGRRR